jgi:hypothetical protein
MKLLTRVSYVIIMKRKEKTNARTQTQPSFNTQHLNNISTALSTLNPSPISVILSASVACASEKPISVILLTAHSTVESATPSRLANDRRSNLSAWSSIMGEMWRADHTLTGLDGRTEALLGA